MARIPESEVERLKREVSVQRLAEARGIKLHRHGADLLGLCPFHDDRNPSLVITPAKNLWHCLGACNEGGTVIDWVMKANGISFRHAVELLRADYLPLAADPVQPVKQSTVPKLPPPVAREADDRALLLQVVDYYSRDVEAIAGGVEVSGFARPPIFGDHRPLQAGLRQPDAGLSALPDKNRVAGAEMRGRLQRLGILRESGHEHFNGSLVIPVFNPAGEVVEMYGRKITPNLREGTPTTCIFPATHRGVWNEEALIASKEIILCEALIDALDVLGCGLPQRDGQLRRERLHSRSSRGLRAARHRAGVHRLRPRRGGQQSRGEAGRRADAAWASSASAWSSRRAWTRTNTRAR